MTPDAELIEKRLKIVRINEIWDVANNLSLDLFVAKGAENYDSDFDSQFLAGYSAKLRAHLTGLRGPVMRNHAYARGMVAARYDLERMEA